RPSVVLTRGCYQDAPDTSATGEIGFAWAKNLCSDRLRYSWPATPEATGPLTGRPPVRRTTTTSFLFPTSMNDPNHPRWVGVARSVHVPVLPKMGSFGSKAARRAVPY